MTTWNPIEKKLPKLTKEQMRPEAFGVQVLIHPPYKMEGASDMHVAFYGTRVTDEPSFYIYGRCIDVTHWMELPRPPSSVPTFHRGQSILWRGIAGTVLGYSRTGKRVRVKVASDKWGSRFVAPESLEVAP